MAEVVIPGPAGRIEGRFACRGLADGAPLALFLHPEPRRGGTMNNRVIYRLYTLFLDKGFACLRMNFRGVGRSEGQIEHSDGALNDANTALEWLQNKVHNQSNHIWVVGYSFGAWIGLQLLMRRPEIQTFVAVSPPAGSYDFSFLAPCPNSGLVVHGGRDHDVPPEHVEKLVDKMRTHRNVQIDYRLIFKADHTYREGLDDLTHQVGDYIDQWLQHAQLPAGFLDAGPSV